MTLNDKWTVTVEPLANNLPDRTDVVGYWADPVHISVFVPGTISSGPVEEHLSEPEDSGIENVYVEGHLDDGVSAFATTVPSF